MTIGAGAVVTVDELLRLQPTSYHAASTSALTGAATDMAITGASITLDTETDGAVYIAVAHFDFDAVSGGTTSTGEGRLRVDGVEVSGKAFHQAGAATSNDRASTGQNWRGTLATAGSHTFALYGNLPAGLQLNSGHCRLTVTITEVV